MLDNAVLPALFDAVLAIARKHERLSADHFSIDGTLIDAWASPKSFRPRDDAGDGPQGKERDYRDEKRITATHVSRTDPEAALDFLVELPGEQRKTVGGDQGHDMFDFVDECRAMKITPHMAMNDARLGGSALDARTPRHAGHALGQRKRKMIETTFG